MCLLGVSNVAVVSTHVSGSRGDLAERYREIQFSRNKLTPSSVVLHAQQSLCDSQLLVRNYLRSIWDCHQHRESGKHLILGWALRRVSLAPYRASPKEPAR